MGVVRCWRFFCTRQVPRRPAWPAGLRERVLRRQGDHLRGTPFHCYHCNVLLTGRRWHVDHYPIPFHSIFDQLCCGVTDPCDETNLVPACVTCNTSHAFERKRRWWMGGRSQCCCCAHGFVAGLGLVLFGSIITFVVCIAIYTILL